jgi:hypothetical protein
MKDIEKKIESINLIKVEKNYRPGATPKYFYNIKLSGIKEELLLETQYVLQAGLVGRKMSYQLDDENIVKNFEFHI